MGRVDWNADTDCLPNNIINGSNAGDLVIGSMADRGGIERMDITVDRGSWLSSISSTNETLRMITVKGGDIDGNGKADDGALYIGDWAGNQDTANGDGPITWTDAAQFLQASGAGTDDEAGLNDVAVFDATGYKGDINIGVDITDASYDKYLKDVDGVDGPDGMAPLAGYNNTFTYITGEGDDVINMTVNGDIAADNDFKMNISTGKGDDLVGFRYEGMSAGQSWNQKNLQNVSIDTGEGDDTVWFYGNNGGSVKINTGAGNDVIYANQDEDARGNNAPGISNAVFVFNTTDTSIKQGPNYNGATLQNDLAVGKNNFVVTKPVVGETLQVTVNFKGHSVTVDLAKFNSDADVTFTAKQINDAIIKAISGDDVLGNLLSAKDGAGHTLIIESLINGEMGEGDLEISFGSLKSDGKPGGTTTIADASTWYDTKFGTTDAFSGSKYTGNNSTTSQVVVDAGAGDDLIVLGPNGNLMDIVKVSGGNDTLFGFSTGSDKLDLSGVLETKTLKTTAANALENNAAIVVVSDNGDKTTGIFTLAEVNKLITAGTLKFGTTTAGTAVVLLEDTDVNGNFVYTIVKLVNGSTAGTATATILGSYTMEAGDKIATGDLIAKDAIATETPVMPTYGANDYHALPSAHAPFFNGTAFDDTFNSLNITDLTYTSGSATNTLITRVNGGTGNDTFNVTGSLSGVILDGGAGDDKFVISNASGDSGSYIGGEGNDTLTITVDASGATTNFGSRITEIETVINNSGQAMTISGDASLSHVTMGHATTGALTLDAHLSTKLTVDLVDKTGIVDTIQLGTTASGSAITAGNLYINNFEAKVADDKLNVQGMVNDASFETATNLSSGIDMTDSGGTHIGVVYGTDLKAENFSTTAHTAGLIQVTSGDKYLFVVASAAGDNDGDVYVVTAGATAADTKVTLLGTLDLMTGDTIADLSSGNFVIS